MFRSIEAGAAEASAAGDQSKKATDHDVSAELRKRAFGACKTHFWAIACHGLSHEDWP